MDRPLSSDVTRRRALRNIAGGAMALAGFVALFGWAPHWFRPALSRADLRTAVVDAGPVEATVSASGVVVPEFEKVLASPLDARVVKILRKPGAALSKGDAILDLDLSDSILALDKLKQDISIKANQQAQKKLELEKTLVTLRSQLELKRVDVKSLAVQVSRQQKLRSAGLNTEEQLRQALVDEEKAKIELQQVRDSIASAELATKAQWEGLALEMATLEKEAQQSRRQLELATTKSDRDGVLTWVVAEEGAQVRKGEVLARIADLTSFRVDATISDVHATRLTRGLPARVKVDDQTQLDGVIAAILPTIRDGIVTVQIALDNKSNSQLRSNLRVDVYIVTARKDLALRVKRGPSASGEGLHDVFVVRGGKVVRTGARLGIASFEHVEVLEGLLEGDEIVVSDMKDYMHLKEVKLNQ
jgi:HlyD family secretion protein